MSRRLQPWPPCGRAAGGAPPRPDIRPAGDRGGHLPSVRGGSLLGRVPRRCHRAHRRGRRCERAGVHRLQAVRDRVPLRRHPPAGTSTAGVAGIAFETPSQPRGTSPLLAWSIGVYTCAVKCDLCSTYDPEGGPHCVRACPTNALFVRDATTLGDARKDKMKAAATANQIMMGRSTNLKEA